MTFAEANFNVLAFHKIIFLHKTVNGWQLYFESMTFIKNMMLTF